MLLARGQRLGTAQPRVSEACQCACRPPTSVGQQYLPRRTGNLAASREHAHKHKRRSRSVSSRVFPFDTAWDVDQQMLASNIFATSIFPYAGFLYHLQKSKKAPRLMLFGFYFLLVFVLATIIAGVYAKLHYGSVLANIDWLHGAAESFLTMTNLFVVLGLRQGIREAQSESQSAAAEEIEQQEAAPK